ncbi:hypothetical protein [Neobacillus sp. SAB-20_R2A]|uniref:hypothetical protein n=1 Tax=Neobacillus sp. SAB-20_R2A TaxID=3120519 RepID=UPI003C6E08BF
MKNDFESSRNHLIYSISVLAGNLSKFVEIYSMWNFNFHNHTEKRIFFIFSIARRYDARIALRDTDKPLDDTAKGFGVIKKLSEIFFGDMHLNLKEAKKGVVAVENLNQKQASSLIKFLQKGALYRWAI